MPSKLLWNPCQPHPKFMECYKGFLCCHYSRFRYAKYSPRTSSILWHTIAREGTKNKGSFEKPNVIQFSSMNSRSFCLIVSATGIYHMTVWSCPFWGLRFGVPKVLLRKNIKTQVRWSPIKKLRQAFLQKKCHGDAEALRKNLRLAKQEVRRRSRRKFKTWHFHGPSWESKATRGMPPPRRNKDLIRHY